ncbi:hypothetical protein TARUN_9699 [Trichoderma arundinaceum]|uniref:U3 snorna associated n=1 Tax=Trichoderma arundinaceum TaxID=490622 RepID=A0A395N8V3_TRIAR|nr:hypothetical protein TARUN_9699 [Trichoderma arundinaceum]
MPVQTRRRKAMQDAAGEEDADTTLQSVLESSPAQKLPTREKANEADVPAKGTLKVFGDEEDELKAPIEPPSSTVTDSRAVERAEAEEEEEDSDDEAPEAVSTAKAAEDIKKSAQAAQKVAKEQAATQKRKRQQRDELLRKQAEERKKADETAEDSSVVKPQPEKSEARQTDSSSSGRKRAEKSNRRTFLPAEFLTDSSSEDEAEDATGSAAAPKRRKVSGVEKRLTRLDAGPKDEVVKSTVYRVAKKTDERLAPKAKKYSKASKDLLLKRNRPAVKSGSGFLTRK